jgi:alpha-1,2-mannosyltransferase
MLSNGGASRGRTFSDSDADSGLDSDCDEASSLAVRVVIYTCDSTPPAAILANVSSKFGITIPPSFPLQFSVVPHGAELLRAESYPRLTMIGQSFGSCAFCYRALLAGGAVPDIFMDTTGAAFTFPVAKLFALLTARKNIRVVTYTHYPTISTDMLRVVRQRKAAHNNQQTSSIRAFVKLVYYLVFAACYAVVGSFADVVMVNSSWTCAHIASLWFLAPSPSVVFPPCDVKGFAKLPLNAKKRKPWLLSIGQFRPEKDHRLQIRAFKRMLDMGQEAKKKQAKKKEERSLVEQARLVLLGGVRDEGDAQRVAELRKLCEELGVADRVDFVVNEPYAVLKRYLGESSVGLHCMWNEHFGIGVVEMMAAGLLTIAHDSGGPKADIVTDLQGGGGEGNEDDENEEEKEDEEEEQEKKMKKKKAGGRQEKRVGFLASTEEEYAGKMLGAIAGGAGREMEAIRANARESSYRFSDEVFEARIEGILREVLEG